ncbi:uncharacterized protein LOC122006239 isoform X2 [Zingiber officinale]|uniref:uncharacterized protein LOC122006239 isoform X2 n=1 Tax=Zingiber officinale TaxID=94328 RepID=UPI001C4C4535|nr:uncharacterized protein LOC122006239 isoform X2 [Zingiber officinale]
MGGIEEAMDDRWAGDGHSSRHERYDRGDAGLRRPPRRPPARFHDHRHHSHRRLQLRPPAWDGERNGNTMRSSLWSQATPHARRVPAALMAHPLPLRPPPPPHVRLRRPIPSPHRPADRPGHRGRPPLPTLHTRPLFFRVVAAAATLPPVPRQEPGQRRHFSGRAPPPPPPHLALRHRTSARPRRRRHRPQRLLVAHHAWPILLHRRWGLPTLLGGLHQGSFLWPPGFPQALRFLRRHAMFGELVLQNTCSARWLHEECEDCSGRPFHLHEPQQLGDNDPHGILCRNWRRVRVATELGAGNGKGARFAAAVSVATSTVIGLFFWLLIMIFHDKYAYIFTSSEEIAKAVDRISILLAFTVLLNSVQPILSGVAVGSGWQALVAYVNIGSYYIIGVPLGILLGWITNLGIWGLWAGMIGGTAVQTFILVLKTVRCDWDKEASNANVRIQKWAKPAGSEVR